MRSSRVNTQSLAAGWEAPPSACKLMQRMIEYGKSRVHPGRSYAYSAKEYHAHPDRDGTGGEGAGDDFDDYHGDAYEIAAAYAAAGGAP